MDGSLIVMLGVHGDLADPGDGKMPEHVLTRAATDMMVAFFGQHRQSDEMSTVHVSAADLKTDHFPSSSATVE